jgi:uncharacterized membrane protein
VTGFATIVFNSRSWLPLVLILIVGIGAALIWAGHRSDVTARIRFGCGLLKLAGVLTLAVCLLEPLLVGQRARPGANVFAIVADNSQSLQIKDANQPQSRGETLRAELTKDNTGWQAALAENFQVRRYSFDSRLQDIRDFADLNFDGRSSALVSSLRTATERWRGQPVAGVLLFTDGNATDVSPDLSGLEGCPPIYPVVLGEDTELRDVSLNKMMVSQTAFEDAPVTVQAEVGAHGFAGARIAARLIEVATSATGSATNQNSAEDSRIVAEQQQSASADDSSLNFRFQIQPDRPGLHFYELDARVQDELNSHAAQSREATLVNNRRIAVVDRGQEPFRILYVGGRPNWEFKFLNRALEDDPQVKMVSLLRIAKREPKFEFKSRDGESSNPLFRGFGDTNEEDVERYDQPVLIRLNTRDEFELRGGFPKTAEELFRYHAVIISDMESDFFTHDQMVLLQQFVSERGGGLLMLGGAESFREGKYAETVVGSMLPVYLDPTTDAKVSDQWKLSLTREGWIQPWTRLRATEADEQTRLDSVPPFKVLNSVRGIKPGASVLATVSDADNNKYPALVVQRFGAGRTAAVLIGDIWRWGMMDESMQKDRAKSWRQLVRWLVSDVPSRVAVTPEPSAGGDSAEVRLVVSTRDETFKPVDNATVQLTVRPVALFQPGAPSELSKTAATNYIQLTADASPNRPGTYEATYVARDAGAYLVEAHVTQPDGQVVGQASAGWASDPSAEEFRSLKPNRAFLQTLAQRTGGEVLKMDALNSFVNHLPERRAPVSEPWSEPLWQKPSIFLFAFACFVVEWGVRRWKGLP